MKTKTAQSYTATIVVDKTPPQAFKAIINISRWWSEEIEGDTEKLNDEFFYHYKDVHLSKMKLVELVPNKKVVWLVLDNYFKFTKDKSEWKGTKLVFDIAEKGGKTEIKFTHHGLVPQYECYDICREAWTFYITESLKQLVTTGKGQPNAKLKSGFDAKLVEKWKLDTEPGAVVEKPKPGNKKSNDYTTAILIDQTPKQAFKAINNVTGWWTENTKGKNLKLKDEFTVTFGETFMTMQVVEFVSDTKVVWLVTDCYKHWLKGNKTEWTGTKLSFEISSKGKKTQVAFKHIGLIPKLECFGGCANAWGEYIQQSLLQLITTGKGQPTPKEKSSKAKK